MLYGSCHSELHEIHIADSGLEINLPIHKSNWLSAMINKSTDNGNLHVICYEEKSEKHHNLTLLFILDPEVVFPFK